jgi:hypothetical protein
MPSDPASHLGAAAGRPWRWFTAACEAGIVAFWILTLLHYRAHAGWLSQSGLQIQLGFLACLAGIVVGRAVQRRGTRQVAGIALRLAFAGVITLIALVGAEYITRFRFRSVTSSGNARQYIAQGRARTHDALNRFGFREREIPPKPPGKYRIAAIGDSFTYGQGIEEKERFTNLLEGFLGSSYEVYNFGGPGNNLPEYLDTLDQALETDPDFVLLCLYINDFETPQMVRPEPYPLLPDTLDYRMQRWSILYDLVSNQWSTLQQTFGITESYAQYMARNLRDMNLPNAHEAYGMLREFVERAETNGAGVGVVLFPAIDAMSAGRQYPFRYLDDGVRVVCAEEEIACLDLLDTYAKTKDPRTLWVSPFDAHPNAGANRQAAFEMLRVFGSEWQRR